MKDLANVRFIATDEELDDMYNKILARSKMKKNDPITYIDLPRGRMGITRLSSGQIKILYTGSGSNEVKWTWLSKGQLKKVFGKYLRGITFLGFQILKCCPALIFFSMLKYRNVSISSKAYIVGYTGPNCGCNAYLYYYALGSWWSF